MTKISNYTHMIKYNDAHFLINNIAGSIIEIEDPVLLEKLIYIKRNREKPIETILDMETINILKENSILCDDSTDEDLLFKTRINDVKNKKELDIILALTLDCNFRCVYCFEKHEKKLIDRVTLDMYIDMIKKICVEDNIEYLRICYYGGEPLLEFENLLYFHKNIMQDISAKKIRIEYLVITNAYLLTADKVDKLYGLNSDVNVQITIDGPATIHNKFRPLANGAPTFDKILKNAAYCSKYLKTNIRLNVDKNSILHLKSFFSEIAQYGLSKSNIKITPYLITANTEANMGYENNLITGGDVELINEIKAFMDFIVEQGYKTDENYKYYGPCFPLGRPKFIHCSAYAGRHLVLCPAGDIFACLERVNDSEYKIGNIYNTPVFNENYDMWNSYSMAEYDKCRECEISCFCGGGCGSKALKNNNCLSPICIKDKYRMKDNIIF